MKVYIWNMIRIDYAIYKYQKAVIRRIKSGKLLPSEVFTISAVKETPALMYADSYLLRQRGRLLLERFRSLMQDARQMPARRQVDQASYRRVQPVVPTKAD